MGNPQILKHPPPAAPSLLPTVSGVTWWVCLLRDQGEKLDREAALRSGQAGRLTLHRGVKPPHELNASLIHPIGYPVLENLYDVRVARMTQQGGMLLHGHVITSRQGVVSHFRQSWWCQVQKVDEPTG